MSRPDRQHCHTLADGSERTFPTFEDLGRHLIEHSEATTLRDIRDDPELLGELLFLWIQEGQLACAFATTLAQDPSAYDWESVVAVPDDDGELTPLFTEVIEASARNSEALQIVFPGLTEPRDVVRLVNYLCERDSWYWERVDPPEDVEKPPLLLGLRWRLPESGDVSQALGFAPFEKMPFTRRLIRAPFSAVILRTSQEPEDLMPRYQSDDEAVHLAHLQPYLQRHEGISDEVVYRYHDHTKENRALHLGSESWKARARITFCLPTELEGKLADPGP